MKVAFFPKKQAGSALIIGLLILLIITIIGVTTMQTTTLQEKMAGGLRDQDLAFQAAEAALRDAEQEIAPELTEPNWIYDLGDLPDDLTAQSDAWWTSDSNTREVDFEIVATPPRYVGEGEAFLRDTLRIGTGPVTGRHIYRTTARGTGGTDNAEVILRTRYAKRYN
ncbi:MAG: pilus assembly PilX family protein [Pseudomonadota bacterium]